MSVLTPPALLLARKSDAPAGARAGGDSDDARRVASSRRRGRPPMLTPEQVIGEIRGEAAGGRLFRVHLERPALYARARRLWGSWADALRAAGLDPHSILEAARQRALETRRRKRGHAGL